MGALSLVWTSSILYTAFNQRLFSTYLNLDHPPYPERHSNEKALIYFRLLLLSKLSTSLAQDMVSAKI